MSDSSDTTERASSVDRILDAVQDVLIRHGATNLTMRRIAEEAGLSLGTVSYTFRDKEDMVGAFVERLHQSYNDQMDQIEAQFEGTPQQAFYNTVRFLVEDSDSVRSVRLFPELWPLANRNTRVRSSLDELYRREWDWLNRLIRLGWPEIDEHVIVMISGTLLPLIEGLALFPSDGELQLTPGRRRADVVECWLRGILQ